MMTNKHEQPYEDEITDAVGYWIGATSRRSNVTIENIERRRRLRTFRRVGFGVCSVGLACVSALSLMVLTSNERNAQLAKTQIQHALQQEIVTVPEINEAHLQQTLKLLQADRDALRSQLSNLEISHVQSRIDHSFALAGLAQQWVADQQKNFQ